MTRILVVDDSSMARKFYVYLLTSLGYQVGEAEDGYLALEMLLANSFDLIITDINMPRMDGFQFIAEIRGLRAYKEIPIFIITSQDLASDIDRGILLGANLYIIKPTEPEKLVYWVRRLLDGVGGREA